MARRRSLSGRRYLPGEEAARELMLGAGVAVARARRAQLGATTFVGITGSAGKSTTKELATAILGARMQGRSSARSSNRLSKVGTAIVGTRRADEFCVVEVGALFTGSVARIAGLLRPDVAVVTRIGLDHYRAFRSLENVAAEKGALVAGLADGGTAVLNADDPHAIGMAGLAPGRVISFGEAAGATLRAEGVTSSWPDPLAFTLHVDGLALPVRTRLHGRHSAVGVLAALGIAHALDVPLEEAIEVVERFEPVDGRMSPVTRDGITFVRDDLKAPAWSFGAVLEFLAEARAERKVAVIGSVSDSSGSSSAVHRRIARQTLEVAELVVFVGPNARHVERVDSDALHGFATVQEAAAFLRTALREGDLVVVKGSNRADHLRRVELDRAVEVRCWRTSCGKVRFCNECRLLGVSSAAP